MAVVAFVGCLGQLLHRSSGTTTGGHDRAVTLFGAASTATALEEIAADFTERHGVEVQSSFASSSTLAQQIVNGAEADLFLSANEDWVDYLDREGIVAEHRDLLGNRLVVILPPGSAINVDTARGLLNSEIRHVALADPEVVPAGMYAKQALVRLGLWEAIAPKVAAAADVRQVLAFVETGAAEAGVVYATDAEASDIVTVAFELDPGLTGPIRYPVALTANGAIRPGAESLYRYLGSPKAAEVFRRHGFAVPASGG